MKRIASLRRAALELRASIFRSLPWGYRVAHFFFTVLASREVDDVARILAAVFFVRHVEGMEGLYSGQLRPGDLKAQVNQVISRIRAPLELRSFVSKMHGTLVHRYGKHNEEFVTGAMLEAITKFHAKPDVVDEGVPLKKAQNLFFTAVHNLLKNKFDKAYLRHEQSGTGEHDGEDVDMLVNLEDPKALESFKQFEDLLSPSELNDLKRDAARVLPWAPGYIDMLMDGYTEADIIGDPAKGRPSLLAEKLHLKNLTNPDGVPMSMGMWSKPGGWRHKVMEVLKRRLQESLSS